jgi:hypothetical protein
MMNPPKKMAAAALFALFTLLALCSSMTVQAHHGWAWAEGEHTELSGRVTESRLGNPHGVLKLDVKGQTWTVEVGQPWRNERAGLKDSMLAPGAELTIIGQRAADKNLHLIKAVRVRIGGTVHDLYPERK